MRKENRQPHEIRKVILTPHVSDYAEGSALVEFGRTRVLCTASLETPVPKFLQNTGQGWVTAEYGMLPRSTHTRIKREKAMGSGRTQEISRLIGRSLRAAVDLKALGERQIVVDCDVINADGGTRTAAVTGGFVALALALQKLKLNKDISTLPLIHYVSAVSVGLQNGNALLDLNYDEDSKIGADVNVVMTSSNHFIEVQGTAESSPFTQEDLIGLMEMARKGCHDLFEKQAAIIGDFFPLKK